MSKENMPQAVFDDNMEALRNYETQLQDLEDKISRRIEQLETDDRYKESGVIAAGLKLIRRDIGHAAAKASIAGEITPEFFGR